METIKPTIFVCEIHIKWGNMFIVWCIQMWNMFNSICNDNSAHITQMLKSEVNTP